jgi:hypothetical protein
MVARPKIYRLQQTAGSLLTFHDFSVEFWYYNLGKILHLGKVLEDCSQFRSQNRKILSQKTIGTFLG